MEIITTIVYGAMLVFACVNWIIAANQTDALNKIASILAAIFFLLLAVIVQTANNL